MRCNGSNWAVYSPGSWDGFRNDVWASWAGVIMCPWAPLSWWIRALYKSTYYYYYYGAWPLSRNQIIMISGFLCSANSITMWYSWWCLRYYYYPCHRVHLESLLDHSQLLKDTSTTPFEVLISLSNTMAIIALTCSRLYCWVKRCN